jgi:isopenicillin N synthase-like dioxygenase
MSADNIPVIDIGALYEARALRAIDEACRDWGFFQVTHHGIDDVVLRDLFDAAHAFFEQPTAVKRRISRTEDNPWGFFDRELTKQTRDWKEVYDFGPGDGQLLVPQWPAALPAFEPAVRRYYARCERLAERLLGAISFNLGMPAEGLAQGFGQAQTSFVRLNYYPACPVPSAPTDRTPPVDGYLGVNHHTDAGALTILLQDDRAGLEVFRDGRWYLIDTLRDALVINIGDIVQVWSNDRYKAALHRVVVSSDGRRYSAPFFYNPSYETTYAPLPSTIDERHPARYRAIKWGEFRSLRAAGDYADRGEEVQISHYAL